MQHLAHYQPVMFAGLESVYGRNPMELTLTSEMMYPYFSALNAISIDVALMEPAAQDSRVFVLPFGTEWSDVGTWQSLERLVREGKVNPPEEVLEHMRGELASRGSK
jgi:mannose-1-phosphate guanylyltransferase